MAKRKRVEAWGEIPPGESQPYLGMVHAESRMTRLSRVDIEKGWRGVHLVESRPEDRAAAAVVRAAVAWVTRPLTDGHADRLCRAVEKYLKAKKGAK